MDDEDRIGVPTREELARAKDRTVLFRVGDVLGYDEHDRVDGRHPGRRGVGGDRLALRIEQRRAVGELGQRILPVIPTPDDDRRLDEPVGDRCRERVAKDDLAIRRLLVGRRSQSDEHPGM